jgi:carbon storage regulator CsrA
MVVITMREQDSVWVGDDIEVVFVRRKGSKEVRIGFRAPKNLKISRDPIRKRPVEQLTDEQLQHLGYREEE